MKKPLHHNKILLKIITFFVIILLASSCQSENALTTKSYELPDFSSFVFNGIGNLTIVQSEINSLTITAEPRFLDRIVYKLEDGVLSIEESEQLSLITLNPQFSIQFHITVNDLESIQFNGAGTLTGTGLTGEKLSVLQNAVGNITLDGLNYRTVNLQLFGGGLVRLNGMAGEQNIDINGAVILDSANLQSSVVNAKLSGTSRAIVWVTDILNVETDELSIFQFYGSPQGMYLGEHPENVGLLGNK